MTKAWFVAGGIAIVLLSVAACSPASPNGPSSSTVEEAFPLGQDISGVIYASHWCATDSSAASLAERVANGAEEDRIDRSVVWLRASLQDLASSAAAEGYEWPAEIRADLSLVRDWALSSADGLATFEAGDPIPELDGKASEADKSIRDRTLIGIDHDDDCTYLSSQLPAS